MKQAVFDSPIENAANAADGLRKTRLNADRQSRASRSNATLGFAVCGTKRPRFEHVDALNC